jgi:hypothetical protein
MIRVLNHVNMKSTAGGILLGYVGIIIITILKRSPMSDRDPRLLKTAPNGISSPSWPGDSRPKGKSRSMSAEGAAPHILSLNCSRSRHETLAVLSSSSGAPPGILPDHVAPWVGREGPRRLASASTRSQKQRNPVLEFIRMLAADRRVHRFRMFCGPCRHGEGICN